LRFIPGIAKRGLKGMDWKVLIMMVSKEYGDMKERDRKMKI